MTIVLYALVCMSAADPSSCAYISVADSSQSDLTYSACVMGQAAALKYVSEHPRFRSWTLTGWRCQIGEKPREARV